ncbi:MAG: alginate export family protein [Alphaproteobacteria bacterium]|nr:alginate export family protein [Alphaproteobacteria bacterium]
MRALRFILAGTFVFLQFIPSAHAEDPDILVKDGKFFGEMRYRYEHVEQNGVFENANANTIRLNLGFKTGTYRGFSGLIEQQLVQSLGKDDFNSLDNGQTSFPTVADPDVAQINQLWVSYTGLPSTEIKVGRQGININNQRFLGTVAWRQNDQTFDAVTVANNSIQNLSVQYGYVRRVNRIFGGSVPPDHLIGHTHYINLSYDFKPWLKASGYGYWMGFDNAASLSNKTFGLRLTGEEPVCSNWTFFYEAEAAKQYDHGKNTADYDEEYYHLEPGIKGYGFVFKAGYEELGGNGTNAFQTPLATLHKYNGWADKFLTTPANGLEDSYLSASYNISNVQDIIDGVSLGATYHDFRGNKGGDYGSEVDLSLQKTFALPTGQPFENIDVLFKFADYDAEDTPFTDTQKFWFQLGTKF